MNPYYTNPFEDDEDGGLFNEAMSDEDMAGDYTPYGTDNTGAPVARPQSGPILSDKIPGSRMPAMAPEAVLRAMQMPEAQNPNPVSQQQQGSMQAGIRTSLPAFRTDAYDKLAAHDANIPMLQKPKLWQRIAAGLLGAGSAVAASQATPYISRPDTSAINNGMQALLHPGREREMQNWQMQRQVLKDQLGAEQAYNSNLIRSGQLDETRRRNDAMIEAIAGKNKYFADQAITNRIKAENAGKGNQHTPINWEQTEVDQYNRWKNSGDPVLMDKANKMYEDAMNRRDVKTIPASVRGAVYTKLAALSSKPENTGKSEEELKAIALAEIENENRERNTKKNALTVASTGAANARAGLDTAKTAVVGKSASKPVSNTQIKAGLETEITRAYNAAKSQAGSDFDKAIAAAKGLQGYSADAINGAITKIENEKLKSKKESPRDRLLNRLKPGSTGAPASKPNGPIKVDVNGNIL